MIIVSEGVAQLFEEENPDEAMTFISSRADDALERPRSGAPIHQHHYHFTLNSVEQTIVVTVGDQVPTSVMLPAEAALLAKRLVDVYREHRGEQ